MELISLSVLLLMGVWLFGVSVWEGDEGLGRLGGSVGGASNFGSGHDFAVRGFEPCVGLRADGSEPGARFGFCVSSLCPSPTCTLSLFLFQK